MGFYDLSVPTEQACPECGTTADEMVAPRRLAQAEAEVERLRAELAALRGESTGVEWGVRWAGRPDEGGGIEQHHERTPDGGESYARRVVGIHDPYGRGSAVLVKRQLGPWVVAPVTAHVVPVHPVEVEPGLWGWSCSCGKASVCTSELDAAWSSWLHRIASSGMATADELAVA